MKFQPPHITNINDVLPFIKNKPEITVVDKGDYTVIDYNYADKGTFDNPYARECRGLKFDSTTGELLARSYHKFHNLDENEEYASSNVNLDLPHYVLDKLDGSMVHNIKIGDQWLLMTRAGYSDVAEKATNLMKTTLAYRQYEKLFEECPDTTFIFEYVGPTNQIVIYYDKHELILTGMRNKTTGLYMDYAALVTCAEAVGFPYVGRYECLSDKLDLTKIRNDNDKEGVVVRFETGAMVKIKSDIYVRKHRSKEIATNFKFLVQLIVDNNLDDCTAGLEDKLKARVEDYSKQLHASINTLASGELKRIVNSSQHLAQKDFALQIARVTPIIKSMLFNVRKGDDPREAVLFQIRKNYNNNTRLRNLFTELKFPIWEADFFDAE